MRLPTRLSGIGLKPSDFPAILADTKGSSLQNNPRDTTKESLETILRNAL
jgi:alcohol dehydrogenase class IV